MGAKSSWEQTESDRVWTAAPQGKRVPAWAGGRSWEFLCFVSTEDAEHQGYCVLRAHAASSLLVLREQGGAGWFREQHFQPLKPPGAQVPALSAKGPIERGGVAGCCFVKVTHPLQ